MAKSVIVIGCKLPSGLTIEHPLTSEKVTLNGLNKVTIVGADYGVTEVDGELWSAWKADHKGFGPLKSNAIFEASSARELTDKGKELAKEKSGFEGKDKIATKLGPAV